MVPAPVSALEKPANGLAGLKYWRQDLLAGLLVSLISLPFSLGIAVASGAPPISGLISAIIAGLLLPFLGGSYVTISGPAAGLAPVLLATMISLGGGSDAQSLARGYPLLLGVIAMAGFVQIVLSAFKAARFSAMFPSTVVEAMLAAIGLLIIAKQLPNFLGVPFHSHEFFGYLREAPGAFRRLDPAVFGLGVACLALIFVLAGAKAKWLKVVPPQVVAVVVGVGLAWALGVGGKSLIHIPDHPFEHGLVVPDFRGLFGDSNLWLPALGAVITLTLIDGVESLATASAVDRIDPYRRKSEPNRVLLAMGISNICSSICGGLTIIPGGVKSKACIEGGGRTLWANFYNAIFLLLFLFVATNAINLIPLSALAAVLIYTGYKLCRPAIWRHMAHVGREQILLFSLTVLATLATDLLWGILFGIFAKLMLSLVLNSKTVQGDVDSTDAGFADGPIVAVGSRDGVGGLLVRASGLFRDPVSRIETADGAYHLYLGRPLVCFNSLYLHNALARIPRGVAEVVLHLEKRVTLIDHTTLDSLIQFVDDFERSGGGHVRLEGLERMKRSSHDPSGLHLAPGALTSSERRAGLQALARFGLGLSEGHRSPGAALEHHGLVSTSGTAAPSEAHPIPRLAGATIRALVRSFRRQAAEAKHEGHPVRSLSRFGLTPGERRCYERCDTLVWWRHAEVKPGRDGSPRHHEERYRNLL